MSKQPSGKAIKPQGNMLVGCSDQTFYAVAYLRDELNIIYNSLTPGGTLDLGAKLLVKIKKETGFKVVAHLQHVGCGLAAALMSGSKEGYIKSNYPQITEDKEKPKNENDALDIMHQRFLTEMEGETKNEKSLQNIEIKRFLFDKKNSKLHELDPRGKFKITRTTDISTFIEGIEHKPRSRL